MGLTTGDLVDMVRMTLARRWYEVGTLRPGQQGSPTTVDRKVAVIRYDRSVNSPGHRWELAMLWPPQVEGGFPSSGEPVGHFANVHTAYETALALDMAVTGAS